MAVRRTAKHQTGNTTITTTTEKAGLTLDAPTPKGPGRTYTIEGTAQVTLGTGTTALTPRIRRGSDETGTLVGEGNAIQGTAGNTVDVLIQVEDTPPEMGTLQYTLCYQQTGATANGTILQQSLEAEVDD